jgi:hypothetical protein
MLQHSTDAGLGLSAAPLSCKRSTHPRRSSTDLGSCEAHWRGAGASRTVGSSSTRTNFTPSAAWARARERAAFPSAFVCAAERSTPLVLDWLDISLRVDATSRTCLATSTPRSMQIHAMNSSFSISSSRYLSMVSRDTPRASASSRSCFLLFWRRLDSSCSSAD